VGGVQRPRCGGRWDECECWRRARSANTKKQFARRGWGSSQADARKFLAAIVFQIEELEEIRRICGEDALDGKVSAGINALKRDAVNVWEEIPSI
jgi:hypothetical protein